MNNKQNGYSYLILSLLIIFVAIVISIVGYFTVINGEPSTKIINNDQAEQSASSEEKISCDEKQIFPIPVDKTFIQSVSYPGQVREGSFKPHGAFRLNTPTTRATVYLPIKARPIAAARYYEQGEIQYLVDFETECKLRLRFDHLVELSPYLQTLVEKLPEAIEGIPTAANIMGKDLKAGETIATKVGFEKDSNVMFDFGLYDFNQKNKSSQDKDWLELHQFENDQYAICWLDYLSDEDETLIRSLPATDATAGKISDYCSL